VRAHLLIINIYIYIYIHTHTKEMHDESTMFMECQRCLIQTDFYDVTDINVPLFLFFFFFGQLGIVKVLEMENGIGLFLNFIKLILFIRNGRLGF
jgi:hypothetical protein